MPESRPPPRAIQPRRGLVGPSSAITVQALEGRTSVPGRAEAYVSLPCERLQQRAGAISEGEAQMPELGPNGDRRPKFIPGHRPAGKRLSGSLPKQWPVRRCQAIEGLPTGQLAHPTGCPQGEVGATFLGGHQVGGAAERERLDDP